MKLVVLIDGSKSNFDKTVSIAEKESSLSVDTENCDELKEYDYLINTIDEFSHSDKQIMFVKFSGRESIVRNLGEERPEMIVSFSYNKNSKYYTESPSVMLSNFINTFKKETSN